MGDLVILVVEDEPEVRAAIVRDLEPLTANGAIRVDAAESVDDAEDALREAREADDQVGLRPGSRWSASSRRAWSTAPADQARRAA